MEMYTEQERKNRQAVLSFLAAALVILACGPLTGGDTPSPATDTPTDDPTRMALATMAFAEPACAQPLCLLDTISLLELQDRPLTHNVLKLFSAAADPARNRVYVAGIMTPHIAVLDGETEEWIDTLDMGLAEGYGLKYLHIDPVANYLYVIDTSNSMLHRLDINTGETAEPVPLPQNNGAAAVDTARTYLYLPTPDSPHLHAIDGHTLETVYTSAEMGPGTGRQVYDAEEDILYVLDIAAQERERAIYRFDPESRAVAGTIVYTGPEGQRSRFLAWDPAHERFFVATDRQLLILGANGSEQHAIPLPRKLKLHSMAYEPTHDRVVLLFVERPSGDEVDGVGGRLKAFDPATGQEVASVSFGDKPHRLTLNTANGRFYVPNGDASVVWSIPTDTYAEAVPLRLGDSVEQVVVTGGGRTLYMNSRLGGSYLVAYDVETGGYETFESGKWPIPIRTGADGERLFVLNAWDSTLAVYELAPERTLAATIPLGLPRGTTDRLPDLAIDTAHHLAYAAYPEFGQIAVVDWESGQAIETLTLDGFPAGAEGGGPGHLQVTVDETGNRLFVLWHTGQRRLQIYDAGYTLAAEVDLSGLNWKAVREGANVDLLFFDAERERLFAGPFELDGATGEPTGRSLAAGQRVLSLDAEAGVYWVSGAQQQGGTWHNIVATVDRETLETHHIEVFGPALTAKPDYAVDVANGRLYVGHLQTAEFEIFAVGD